MSDNRQLLLAAYDQYADAIYRHCFFRVFNKAKAEELMQETFLKVWVYMEKGPFGSAQGREVKNIRAFLYRVANNLIIDYIRRKKEESLDAMTEDENFIEPAGADQKDLEKEVLLNEVKDQINDLPEDYKQILIMRYVDDLEPREIAEVLDLDANNVSVKIHRGLMMLKSRFKI